MFIGSSMLYKTDITNKLYHELAELEEKLLKSEAERKNLEVKFQHLAQSYQEEEEKRTNQLNEKYNEFVRYCKERNDRNEKILRSLERVETGANVVFAKTERLKRLRTHYNAYLTRMTPIWQQMPTVQDLGHARLMPAQPMGRRPVAFSANTAPLESLHLLTGDGGIDDVHAYGGGSALIGSGGGFRKIGYGPIYVIPEKEISALEEVMYRVPNNHQPLNLGEAGERMLKELKIGVASGGGVMSPESVRYGGVESFKSASMERKIYEFPVKEEPKQYPRYGLWPHVQNPPCGTEALNYSKGIAESKSNPLMPSPNIRRSPSPNYDSRHSWAEERKPLAAEVPRLIPINNLKLTTPKEEFIRREKSRDNFEIECLSADGNYIDEDQNLSDDEVLNSAMNRSSVLGMEDEEPRVVVSKFRGPDREQFRPTHESTLEKQVGLVHKNGNSQHWPRQNERTVNEQRFENTSSMAGIAGRNELENVAKRSMVTHQKSVEELKTMLSLEEDEKTESPMTESQRPRDDHEEEDVPEEFTEQPWSDGHHDPRYERDVSRNVILEEDEPEDHYEETSDERRHARRDWRRVQHFREQGKLIPQRIGYSPVNERLQNEYTVGPRSPQEMKSPSPVLSGGSPADNLSRPRMLTTAINLFKDRRRSVGADNQAIPTSQSLGVPVYYDGPQITGKEVAPVQRNDGNYHRRLVEEEQARRNDLLRYDEREQIQGRPEQQPTFMTEEVRETVESHPFLPDEQKHGNEKAESNIIEERELERVYNQTEYLETPKKQELNVNAQSNSGYVDGMHVFGNGDVISEPNENLPFQQHGTYMQEGEELHERYGEQDLDRSNLQPEGFYGEDQQRYDQYNPPEELGQYQEEGRQAHEVQFNQNDQERNYTNGAQFYDDGLMQGADDQNVAYEGQYQFPVNGGEMQEQRNYPPDHYVEQPNFQDERIGEEHYNSNQQEGYEVHHGSYQENNEQPIYQKDHRQDEYYREGELNQQQYPNKYEEYQAQDLQFNQEHSVNPQRFPNQEETGQYQDYGASSGIQSDGNVYRDVQEYEPTYEDEKGQAEYEGQNKEQFQAGDGADLQTAIIGGIPAGVQPSVMAQLIDSESESYQVSAEPAPDDSDFDFSMGK